MKSPTAQELLLAAEVRRRIIEVRKAEIKAAFEAAQGACTIEEIEASWEKPWREYIHTVTDELSRIWGTISERLATKA